MLYLLIAGYLRTGKDTLHNILKSSDHIYITIAHNTMIPFIIRWLSMWVCMLLDAVLRRENVKYYILAKNPDAPQTIASLRKIMTPTRRVQLPFAGALKDDVHVYLGIDGSTVTDAMKTEIVEDKKTGKKQTLRQFYIDRGAEMRSVNIDYWVEKVMEKAQNLSPSDAQVVDVTDLRFRNEHTAIRRMMREDDVCLSARIFRWKVPIPPKHIESEHDIDAVSTDILIVTGLLDLVYALYYFPQYLNYILVGEIRKYVW